MNKTQHTTQIPDKALKLLPWYATGWLTSQERTYVQKTLSQYPEFQEMLDSEHKMINAIKELEAKPSRPYRIFEMEISDPF